MTARIRSKVGSATRFALLCAAAAVCGPMSVMAETPGACAPEKMVKIVSTSEIPGAETDPFMRAPKTIYRQGTRYGRIEEELNPRTKSQVLIVVNEPDVWFADLEKGKGQHVRDSGPTYNFRAHIFGEQAAKSTFARSIEFGCELSAMRAAGARESQIDHHVYGKVTRLAFSEGAESVVLLVSPDGKPRQLELVANETVIFVLTYTEYTRDLDLDPKQFTKPAGIEFEEPSKQ